MDRESSPGDWQNGLSIRDAISIDHGSFGGEIKRSHEGRDDAWDLEFPLPFGDRLVYRVVYAAVEYTAPATVHHALNGLGTSPETFAASVRFGATRSLHRAVYSPDGTLGAPPKAYPVADQFAIALADYIADQAEEIIIEERGE